MSKSKKRNSNRIIIILGIVVIALVALVIWKGGNNNKDIEVEIGEVEARTIVETVAASGKIFPEVEVKISSGVSGEVVDLLVEEGDSVIAGELLVRVQPDSYQSILERAEASVNSSKAQLANSRAQEEQMKAQLLQVEAQLENNQKIHERNQRLYKDGVISDVDLEASETSLKTTAANYESVQANLKSARQSIKAAEFNVQSALAGAKEARNNLSLTEIHAPKSGIVSRLNIEQGEQVVGAIQMTGTEILRIANLDVMEVQVEVSENDVLRVNVGDTTDVEVDAYIDRKFQGIVTQIANSASNPALAQQLNTDQITNFIVKIRLFNNSYEDLLTKGQKFPFRPGMSASVEIRTETEAGILSVPIQAVTAQEKNDEFEELVFVYKNDSVEVRTVSIGIQDADYIQILEGLTEGEEIVIGPYSAITRELEGGTKVKVKKDDD